MLHRLVIAIGMIGGLAVTSPLAQEAASPRPQTFRSAVDLVTIQASVRDARGRIVTGLTATDFEVRDNGQLRPILSLRSDRQSPLSVAILVDMSGSMRLGPKKTMARQAYDSVLSQLRPDQDEVALFTFDAALHEVCDFTRDLAALKKNGLPDFEPFGTTSLYDATAAAARRLAARSGTHKAIIVLTDGIDTSSAMTARDVSGLAASIDVPVFIIATMPSLDQRAMMENARAQSSDTADLRDLAHWTGGQFVFASTFVETVSAASHLIDDLRQQYVLAIETADVREWRRLDVRVKRPSTTVKARSGYFAG
jgi:VWFA-related protein